MKKILCLVTGLLTLNLTGFGQQQGSTFSDRMAAIRAKAAADASTAADYLTKFNLDFPGGTAAELVKAIEKAMGKPLNVIIAADEKSAKAKLPPVKVTDMDVARLFKSLEQTKYEHNEIIYKRQFYSEDQQPKDNSLWTFSVFEKQSPLTQFNLDFPGGTPAQLIKAIEKAISKPMNVVIADEDADTKIPALKMNDVNVRELFSALEKTSFKQVAGPRNFANSSYQLYNLSYGFKTEGEPTDNSIWYFHADKPTVPPEMSPQKATQYFSLAPYLDRGFTVDDITTAIQTGWKLAGVSPVPDLNYHKETKLLIAYGEPDKLNTINQVLSVLPTQKISWQEMHSLRGDLEGAWAEIKAMRQKIDALTPTNTPPATSGRK